jgi:hypothetical protein
MMNWWYNKSDGNHITEKVHDESNQIDETEN